METLYQWIIASFGPDVDWKQVFLIGASPLFLLAFFIEWRVMIRRGRASQFYWKEVLANISLGASYQVFEVLMWVLATGAIFAWVYQFRLFDIPVNAWTVIPIFVGVEFCYYWFHRASHRIRWFWTAHVPHHSGEVMNFTTAMRQSLLNAFIGIWVFYLPPVILGVPPAVVMFMLAVDLVYQYFVHTESIGRLPAWYEYLFDTPSNHRVHHGRNAQYIDKNYGGVLIIFDRWFGTYEPEVEKVNYGIVRQVRSYNFLVLNVHEFVDMLRDVLAPGPLWQRLKHLWKPPEWERPGHRPVHTWTTEIREPAAKVYSSTSPLSADSI
ncbi:MAG: sterol desaturase family protein [Hydrocarboniphaga effusa]|nr:sterol desaturase family protein [Hydrocarboniphaga effusa]